MKRIYTFLLFSLLMIFLLPSFVISERGIKVHTRRLALVIGNSAYETAPLKNPVNDAKDMADSLKKLGFDVIYAENAGQEAMKLAILDFGRKLRKGGVGLFYFAGHGIQVKGRNYLIPVDAKIESESDVEFDGVDAGRVLGKMEDAENDLNIVILDACRNNPFARSFRSETRGLARMDAPTGSIIAYSTAPGSVAEDGEGRNGIYTKHLLKQMKTPSFTIEQIFKEVRKNVIEETQEKQVPWESSSLVGDFYFVIEGKMTITTAPSQKESAETEYKSHTIEPEKVKITKESKEDNQEMKVTDEVQTEIERLKSTDPVERANAAKSLGNMGRRASPAIPHLLEMIDDSTKLSLKLKKGDPFPIGTTTPGSEAASALARMGSSGIEALAKLINDDNKIKRDNALSALAYGYISNLEKAIEPLIACMEDEDLRIRKLATRALSKTTDPRSLDPLISALSDENAGIRELAIKGVGNFYDEKAVLALIEILNDENPKLRKIAIKSLGKIKDYRAIEPLIEALNDEDNSNSDEAYLALFNMTGNPYMDQNEWKQWWKQNKKEYLLEEEKP